MVYSRTRTRGFDIFKTLLYEFRVAHAVSASQTFFAMRPRWCKLIATAPQRSRDRNVVFLFKIIKITGNFFPSTTSYCYVL